MPTVATVSSVATHSCSFEYLSPGGASSLSSNKNAGGRPGEDLKQPGAADIECTFHPSSAAPPSLSSFRERAFRGQSALSSRPADPFLPIADSFFVEVPDDRWSTERD